MSSLARRQQGVALITVLLIVALIAVVAVSMSGRLKGQVSRAHAVEQAEQGYWHWLSAEQLVRQVLHIELQNDGYVHRGQNWAQPQGPFPVAGGLIAGQLRDLHSCFNLNALGEATVSNNEEQAGGEQSASESSVLAQEQYQALLVALEFDDFTAQQLTATLIDWLDQDRVLINQYGAEDADYESLPRPYQAANTLMAHVSELRQVRGYTQEVYQRLRPYICVLPLNASLAFNPNTMDPEKPELLSAVFFGELDIEQARSLLDSWPAEGYAEVSEITALPELQNLIPEGQESLRAGDSLTTQSEHFELRASIQFGNTEFFATSIVQIREGEVRVLHRSRRGYNWDD